MESRESGNRGQKSLREELIEKEVVFEGRMISLERDLVRLPNGQETTREVVRHPGAVAVVALRGEDLLLVRQYRYAIEQETLEIPAGKLDYGEDPLACAQRELREETGHRGELTFLGKYYTTSGFTDEAMYLYLAQDLIWDPLSPDEDEFLDVVAIPWADAVGRAQRGEFPDAKTALGILYVSGRLG